MKAPLQFSTPKGFGLIEVLITMLVLGVALLALAEFQATLMQGSSHAKARSIALNLAQEKLEDLRSLEQLPSADKGTFTDEDEITASNVTYNRAWEVIPYYYCPGNSPEVSELKESNDCGRPYPDFNIATMTVTWLDQTSNWNEGDEQQETEGEEVHGLQVLELQSIINASNPTKNLRALASPPPNEKPFIGYAPGQRPEVIDFDVGDDTKKEATDPEPDISRHEVSTITRFDEVYYAASTLRTLRRDEFLTVNCTCEQLGVPTGNQEKGLSPTFFNGKVYELSKPVEGKRTGGRVTGGQLNAQPKLCDICCRDHHDASSYPLYDPFRHAIDNEESDSECSQDGEYLAGGDHKHCYPDENGVLQPADDVGDLYLEACRFVRVNGFLRVAQDWQLEALHLLPDDYLLTDAGVAAYTAYVKRFVEEYIMAIGSDYPEERPDPANFSSTFQNLLDALLTSITLAPGNQKQLLARGLYIDYMNPSLLKLLQCKINPSSHQKCPNAEPQSFLEIAPFHEVNLTRLANWSVEGESVAVTDEPIENGKEEIYSRGFITAVGAGKSTVTATIELSNTGLTDSRTIDPHDGLVLSDIRDKDDISLSMDWEIDVIVSNNEGSERDRIVAGTISISKNVQDREPSHILVTGNDGAICTKLKDTEYRCTLDGNGNGTITFSNYTTELQNNRVEPTEGGMVVDDCLPSESVIYSFIGVEPPEEGEEVSETMNIVIRKQGSGGCSS
jgi:prepilin-type N-terminal cleavage/methylation domain-containing protein